MSSNRVIPSAARSSRRRCRILCDNDRLP
jgi:hypothetical protein